MALFSRLFHKRQDSPESALPVEEAPPSIAPATEALAQERIKAAIADEENSLRAAIARSGDSSAEAGPHPASTDDAALIARLAIEGASTRIRQLAAEAIHDAETVKRVLRDSRGKDKNVYKILKQKNDAQLAREREAAQTQAAIETRCASLERHSHRPYDELFAPTLDHFETEWQALASQASAEMAARAQQAIDRGRETIAEHLRTIAARAAQELAAAQQAATQAERRAAQQAAASAAAAEAAAAREAEAKARDERLAAEALALRQIGGLISKALGALHSGGTGRTAGLRRAIEEKLPAAPALPAYLARQLEQLDAKLNELKDWKDYAAAPKRMELIEEMESLIGSSMEPTKLADQIKSLQEEWRTVSKGAGENAEAEWQRFHEAAQKAYQPCREYFEAQARLRQDNLDRRKALLERLTAFEAGHDWEQPDWRTVAMALRESKQEWRHYAHVDRAAGKILQANFDAVHARLQARLDEEHADNIRQRKALIARAQHLLTFTDSRKALDEVRTLQLRWKEAGAVPRDQDAALWDEFRRQCDAVFQRRNDEQTKEHEEFRAKKAEERATREELKETAKLYGVTSSDAAKFSQLGSALEALKSNSNGNV